MNFLQTFEDLLHRDQLNAEETIQFVSILASIDVESIKSEDLIQNFASLKKVWAKIIKSAQNTEFDIDPRLCFVAKAIQTLIDIYLKIKSANSDFDPKNITDLAKLQNLDTNINDLTKFNFQNIPNQPNYQKFLDLCTSNLTLHKVKFEHMFKLAFYFNNSFQQIENSFKIDLIIELDEEVYSSIEFTEENLQMIVEMIPNNENEIEFSLIRYIYLATYGEIYNKRITVNFDALKIVEQEKTRYLLNYFNFNPIPAKDTPNDLTQTLLLLLNEEIRFDAEITPIPSLISKSFIATAYYCQQKYSNNPYSKAIIDQAVYGRFWLASNVISNSYFDTNLLFHIKNLLTKASEASYLVEKPEVLPFLDDKNQYHHRLRLILEENNEFPEDISQDSEIKLFKLQNTQNIPDIKNKISNLLIKMAEEVRLDTIRDTKGNGFYASLLNGGFLPPIPETCSPTVFTKKEDLIETQTFHTIISNMISLLASMKPDNSIAEKIGILLCHRYISQQARQSLITALGNTGEQVKAKYMSQMMAFAMIEAEHPISAAYKVKTVDNVPIDVMVTIVKFLESDLESLCEFFGNTNSAQQLFDRLSESSRKSILKSLIISGNSQALSQLNIDSEDIKTQEMIFELCGNLSTKCPISCLTILERIISQAKSVDKFFENIPENIEDTTPEFISLISRIFDACQKSDDFTPPLLKQLSRISTKWDEDVKIEKKIAKDIWNEEAESNRCRFCFNNNNKSQNIMFQCYTCPENPIICLECASNCHKGHDIVCINMSSSPCHCETHCLINNEKPFNNSPSQNSSPKKPKGNETKKEISISPNTLAKFVIKLSNCKLAANTDNPQSMLKYHGDIKSYQLKTKPFPEFSPLVFKELSASQQRVGDGNKIRSNLEDVNESFVLTRRRVEVAPLKLAATILHDRFVVFGFGCKLTVMTPDFQQKVSTATISKVIMMIQPCPDEPNVIAVSSLHNVYLFDVSEDGILSFKKEIELRLKHVDSSFFVNNIQWIPESKKLLITTNGFVSIYDNISGQFNGKFEITHRMFITSSCIIQHENKYYILVALSQGSVAIIGMPPDGSNEKTEITRFSNLRFDGPLLTLSSHIESNLLFISHAEMLHVMKPAQIFSETPEYVSLATQFSGNISLVDILFGTRIFLFSHTNTNVLFTVEFTDSGIEFYCMHTESIPVGCCSMHNNTMILLCSFQLNNRFYSVTNSGQIVEVVPNVMNLQIPDAAILEDEGATDNRPPVVVPPLFWMTASTDTKDVEVKDYDGNNISEVLQHHRMVFSSNCPRKSAFVTLNDNERVIVGFRVILINKSASHRPPWISILGRLVDINSTRSYMFPLLPGEVEPRKTYEIKFGSREYYDTNFDALEVYSMPWSDVKSICESFKSTVSWTVSSGLSDYKSGRSDGRCNSSLFPLLLRLENCFICCAKKEKIEKEIFEKIVHLIYKNDSLSEVSRRIASICQFDGKDELWSSIAAECVKSVTKGGMKEYWRDFNLIRKDDQIKVANEIWNTEHNDEEFDPNMIVSAFMSTV